MEQHGVAARDIVADMIADLSGQTIFFNGGLWDAGWLEQLMKAGGCEDYPFGVRGCDHDWMFPNISYIERQYIEQAAWLTVGKRHRAGNDVRFFIEFLRLGRDRTYVDNVEDSDKSGIAVRAMHSRKSSR